MARVVYVYFAKKKQRLASSQHTFAVAVEGWLIGRAAPILERGASSKARSAARIINDTWHQRWYELHKSELVMRS